MKILAGLWFGIVFFKQPELTPVKKFLEKDFIQSSAAGLVLKFKVMIWNFREYLLGFRKRKNERRKKAQEELTKKEKERKRELKLEVGFTIKLGNIF